MDNTNTNSKTVFYFLLVVVVVVLIGWIFYSFGGVSNQGVIEQPVADGNVSNVVAPDKATVSKNKAEIMDLVARGGVLTQEERVKITTALNGELINFYNFTEDEKKQIIDALNKN